MMNLATWPYSFLRSSPPRGEVYGTLEELQADIDAWLVTYNHERTHQGKMRYGRTQIEKFEDGKRISWEKSLNLD